MAGAVPLPDYYGVLNLPTNADISGIQNAYARLSGELAQLGEVDPASSEALRKLNEAYGILGRAELRTRYDSVFLAAERATAESEMAAHVRRRRLMQNAIIAALGLIVLAQASALVYLGWDHVSDVLSVLLGPLLPGGAG